MRAMWTTGWRIGLVCAAFAVALALAIHNTNRDTVAVRRHLPGPQANVKTPQPVTPAAPSDTAAPTKEHGPGRGAGTCASVIYRTNRFAMP